MIPSRGFQSSVDYKIIIGLGKIAKLDSIIIDWPDQTCTKLENPAINQTHIIQQAKDKKAILPFVENNTTRFFTEVKSYFEKHQENNVIDFYTERNIPKFLSREGPKSAVGDVDGDGLEDVFIGGTPGYPGQLYLQTKEGSFEKKEQKAFERFLDFEDVAVLLVDCDQDQ